MSTPPPLEFLSRCIMLYESGKISSDAMPLESLVSVMMRICGRCVSMRPATLSFFPFKLLAFVITVLMESGYHLGFLEVYFFWIDDASVLVGLGGALFTLHFPLTFLSLMGGTFGSTSLRCSCGQEGQCQAELSSTSSAIYCASDNPPQHVCHHLSRVSHRIAGSS